MLKGTEKKPGNRGQRNKKHLKAVRDLAGFRLVVFGSTPSTLLFEDLRSGQTR